MDDTDELRAEWLVPLEGDTESLVVLEQLKGSDGCSVKHFAEKTVLASAQFGGRGAEDIRHVAEKLLAALVGAVRLHDSTFRAVRIGPHLYRTRQGGGEKTFDQWTLGTPMEMRVVALPPALGLAAGPSSPPTFGASRLAAAALAQPALADVLKWYGQEPVPFNLRKAYELIRADCGGERALKGRGWANDSELSRFKQTLHHPAAMGDLSLHAKSSEPAPQNPMTILQATEFMGELIKQWITYRGF